MITGKQALAWTLTSVGLTVLVLTGCARIMPGLGGAKSALEDEEYQEALEGIEQALEQDSANVEAYLLRAKTLRRMADSTMAPDEYKALHRRAWEAEEKALSFKEPLRGDVRTRREEIYNREIEQGERAYNRANKNEQQDLYRRSAAFFAGAGAVQPDSARPVLNEAYSRLRAEQRREVIPVLEEYTERADTVSKKAYKILSQLYLETDQAQPAIDLLGQAIQTYPSDRELQALRLNVYNQVGDADRALASYRDLLETYPDVARYRYNYGALLLEAERYADAIAQLEKAIEIRPTHLESQYNLGAAYVNAALARDDSIAVLEEDEGSRSDTTGRQEQIEALTRKRQTLFEEAIPPLLRVRKMASMKSAVRRDACRALMVAFIQTNRPNRAAQVERCTGFAQPDT